MSKKTTTCKCYEISANSHFNSDVKNEEVVENISFLRGLTLVKITCNKSDFNVCSHSIKHSAKKINVFISFQTFSMISSFQNFPLLLPAFE